MAEGEVTDSMDCDAYFARCKKRYTTDLAATRASVTDHESRQETMHNQITETTRQLQQKVADTGTQLIDDLKVLSESIQHRHSIRLQKLQTFATSLGKAQEVYAKHIGRDGATRQHILSPLLEELAAMEKDMAAISSEELYLEEKGSEDPVLLLTSLFCKIGVKKSRLSAFSDGKAVSSINATTFSVTNPARTPTVIMSTQGVSSDDGATSSVTKSMQGVNSVSAAISPATKSTQDIDGNASGPANGENCEALSLEAQIGVTIPRDKYLLYDLREQCPTMYLSNDRITMVHASAQYVDRMSVTVSSLQVYSCDGKLVHQSPEYRDYTIKKFAVTDDPQVAYVISAGSKFVDTISLSTYTYGEKKQAMMLPIKTSEFSGIEHIAARQPSRHSSPEIYVCGYRQVYKCIGRHGSFLPFCELSGKAENICLSDKGSLYAGIRGYEYPYRYTIECYSSTGQFLWCHEIKMLRPKYPNAYAMSYGHTDICPVKSLGLAFMDGSDPYNGIIRILSEDTGLQKGVLLDKGRHGIVELRGMSMDGSTVAVAMADRVVLFKWTLM